MNECNLIPFDKRTENEQREIRSKGGKASGQRRRQLKTFKEALEILLTIPEKEGKVTPLNRLKNLSKEEIDKANLTASDRLAVELLQKALNGNLKAYEYIRDQLGQKPIEEHRINVEKNEDKALQDWIKRIEADDDLKQKLKED